MKKILAFFLLMSIGACAAKAQTIPYVTTDHGHDPVISESANIGDAVEIIMDFLTNYAGMKCSNSLNASLKTKIDSIRTAYVATIPKGKTAAFLVFTDAINCKVTGIVSEKQTIRMNNNTCSVKDVQLEDQAYIYDPTTTGFFTVNITF